MATTTPFNSFPGPPALPEYLVDAAQATVLYWDVMRQRGNQYLESMEKEVPHVLQFEGELVADGRKLPQPVNYLLVRIKPPKGTITDERKRPFVVIDPRAGHGPGIGGFKADSEIGVALGAGHPCYFIGFTPKPEPEQTIEAVMRAEARFLERVIERHPKAEGKPVVIGNCQAGWAAMMLAATRPDLCGPIIAAGSPLSYWAGVKGVNPMRYTGGLLGGSWLATMFSDLGNGLFDGAWLVQNFESLNPANTLWSKQYNLYAKVDTEGPRYLGFEKWWGGHVILSGEEIQYIVDNLFVGNKLSTARMVTSDGVRIDFRKIRSPIICFCSKGDNITPPQQALDWILDLYSSVDDIRAHGQTIVYAVHDRIGHLGIFVAGSVAKKEHREFTSNIDLIDCLPPGLYEAIIEKKGPDAAGDDLITGDFISRFEFRTLDDIRAMGGNDIEEERAFATVARLSEITNGVYRTAFQDMVRSMTNEQSAEWMRRMHPLRLSYELLSDRNPLMKPIAQAADWVREHRQPAKSDNAFLQWQNVLSDSIAKSLDAYAEWRDHMQEQMFFTIFGNPWLQAMLGLRASDGPPRPNPGQDPEDNAFVERRIEELRAGMEKGGPREAVIRALVYVKMPENATDERGFEMIRRIRAERDSDSTLDEFKKTLREQFFMLLIDERRALETLPKLLKGYKEAPKLLDDLKKVAKAGGPLGKEAQRRLDEVGRTFNQ